MKLSDSVLLTNGQAKCFLFLLQPCIPFCVKYSFLLHNHKIYLILTRGAIQTFNSDISLHRNLFFLKHQVSLTARHFQHLVYSLHCEQHIYVYNNADKNSILVSIVPENDYLQIVQTAESSHRQSLPLKSTSLFMRRLMRMSNRSPSKCEVKF